MSLLPQILILLQLAASLIAGVQNNQNIDPAQRQAAIDFANNAINVAISSLSQVSVTTSTVPQITTPVLPPPQPVPQPPVIDTTQNLGSGNVSVTPPPVYVAPQCTLTAIETPEQLTNATTHLDWVSQGLATSTKGSVYGVNGHTGGAQSTWTWEKVAYLDSTNGSKDNVYHSGCFKAVFSDGTTCYAKASNWNSDCP